MASTRGWPQYRLVTAPARYTLCERATDFLSIIPACVTDRRTGSICVGLPGNPA